MLRLLRLKVWKKWLSSSPKKCGPTWRPTSPPSLWFSILMISAPEVGEDTVPNGPAPWAASTARTRRREREAAERNRSWKGLGCGADPPRARRGQQGERRRHHAICTDKYRGDRRGCQSRARRRRDAAPGRTPAYRRNSIRYVKRSLGWMLSATSSSVPWSLVAQDAQRRRARLALQVGGIVGAEQHALQLLPTRWMLRLRIRARSARRRRSSTRAACLRCRSASG